MKGWGINMTDVIAFAKGQGYESAKYLYKWHDFDVYEPIFKANQTSFIGVPLVILVKDDNIRMSTVDEAFEQLDDDSSKTACWDEVSEFWQYLTTDEDGCMNGIREDAPDKAKAAYEQWFKDEKDSIKKGIKT